MHFWRYAHKFRQIARYLERGARLDPVRAHMATQDAGAFPIDPRQ